MSNSSIVDHAIDAVQHMSAIISEMNAQKTERVIDTHVNQEPTPQFDEINENLAELNKAVGIAKVDGAWEPVSGGQLEKNIEVQKFLGMEQDEDGSYSFRDITPKSDVNMPVVLFLMFSLAAIAFISSNVFFNASLTFAVLWMTMGASLGIILGCMFKVRSDTPLSLKQICRKVRSGNRKKSINKDNNVTDNPDKEIDAAEDVDDKDNAIDDKKVADEKVDEDNNENSGNSESKDADESENKGADKENNNE